MDTSMNVVKASPSAAAMALTTHAIMARALTGAAFSRAFKATPTTVVGTDRNAVNHFRFAVYHLRVTLTRK
jgi:hypothetical protein